MLSLVELRSDYLGARCPMGLQRNPRVSIRLAAWVTTILSMILAGQRGAESTYIPFEGNFYIDYYPQYVNVTGSGSSQLVTVTCTPAGCTRFRSMKRLKYGQMQASMKAPLQNATGIATTLYAATVYSTERAEMDEIDIEFMHGGSKTLLQTNWWRNGIGGHEVYHDLWFDPTADFHDYKIVWGPDRLSWYVDGVRIRTLSRSHPDGYPERPMYLYASMWEAPEWLGPPDWTKGNFVAQYKNFYWWSPQYFPLEITDEA